MLYRDTKTTMEAGIRDLTSPSVKARVNAAEALGRPNAGQEDQAAEALRPLLDDPSPDVRYMTALSLGRLQDSESVNRLVLMAQQDEEPMPKQAALAALGDIGDSRAAPVLMEALGDASAEVRFHAATALSLVAPQLAPEPLQQALGDADAEVRASAAAGLGDLGHLDSRDRLAELLQGADEPQVHLEAAMALARMGDRRGTPVLTRLLGHRDYRLLAAEHLFRCPDPEARQALREALYRRLCPPLLKVWAAAALSRLGDRPARDWLLQLLHHKSQPVRGLTIQLLGAIDQPWSRNALESLLEPDMAAAFGQWHQEIVEALRSVQQPPRAAPSA